MTLWPMPCGRCSLLIAHPVGDGNAIELQGWGAALLDCGGDARADQCLRSASTRGMSEFLLTHLHCDHYSGVTKQPANIRLANDVEHLLLPALPLIHDKALTASFALALFTVNAALGGRSGIPEQDLKDSFTALNPTGLSPSHELLAKGDLFDLAGVPFQVLWPPRAVSGLVASAARNAVEAFDDAIEGDKRAKLIRDQLVASAQRAADIASKAATVDEGARGSKEATEVESPEAAIVDHLDDHENVPQSLKDANRAIRGVANRLSLAFRSGNRLLHLGDLESSELNQVVVDLGATTGYLGMIAAHHGTHFGTKMKRLYTTTLVVSNGQRRPNVKPDYRNIAGNIQETNVHGHCFLVF